MGDSKGMYIIVWRYRVETGCDDAFWEAYGSAGDWAALFGRSAGYEGTTLVALDAPGGYLTIDRWADEFSFRMFLRDHQAAYEELDQRLAPLTEEEEFIGRGFERIAGDENRVPG